MRMRIFMLLALFSCGVPLQAQENTAIVYGTVLNATSSRPVSFATVSLHREENPGEDPFAATLTNERGYFELSELPPGTFELTITHDSFGSTTDTVLVFAANDNYNLGEIALSPASQAVAEEITVTGQRRDAGPSLESRVYNMEDNIAQSTGSLLDVMRTLPGVTVQQEGRIQLRGSDRVVILIDGKQSSLTGFGNQAGLDSIPAGNIASIEIINNPSSRFDATGMAGIVNITYKEEDAAGFNGDIGMTVGTGVLSKRREDLPTDLGSYSYNNKIIPSVNLSYNGDGKRYFFNTEVLKQDDLPNNEFTTRYYDDGRVTLSQVPENREQIQYIINGGMDWNIDADNLLTLSALLDYESHEDNAEVPFINAADMQRYRFWFWREEEVTGYFNVNAEFEHRFAEPGHQLSASAQYTKGWEDEDYYLNDRSALRQASDSTHLRAREHTLPLQIDYVKPLRRGRLEVGAKYQKRWIPVQYDVVRGEETIIYEGLGDWSEWGESVYSTYANLVYETLDYGIEGGFRLEQTDVYYDLPPENIYYAQNDAYDYFKVYPNLKLSYKIDANNSIAAYYSSRVDRPTEAELRIFPKYDDPELLKVGNPYLRPQFTDSVELSYEHQWANGSLIASLYHREIEDAFMRVYAIDASNPDYDIINRIYQNVGTATNDGLELIFSHNFGDFWQFSGSFNWYENTIEGYQTQLLFPEVRPFTIEPTSDDTWTLNVNNQVFLPWDLRLQLSYTYYAPRNIPQGYERARSSTDLGLSRLLFNDQAELVLSVTDLFNRFGVRRDIKGAGFDALYENYYETQVVSLGLKYTF